jgi:pimeloyl-ACP methyl ester carboxylesterase
MPRITTKDGVEIFYKDWGSGQPIVFSHGWPLSADDWDNQMLFFLSQGAFASSPMTGAAMADRPRLMAGMTSIITPTISRR